MDKVNRIYKRIKDIGIVKTIYWMYLKKFSRNKYNLEILNFLKKENSNIIEYYRNYEQINCNPIKDTDKIWFCWWQGYSSMPMIVKSCYEKILEYSGDREVIFISKENFSKYTNFPKYLLDKFEAGNISITHFSDILRMNLLSNNGGVWIDATIYVTDYFINDKNENLTIYSRRTKNSTEYISNGMWTGYFIATGKNNLLATACYEIFLNYWKTHYDLIDYFLIDYIIYLLYIEIDEINNQINSIPFNNEGIHNLVEVLNEKFKLEDYNKICKKSNIHKLTWKRVFKNKDSKDELTYYGYIVGE